MRPAAAPRGAGRAPPAASLATHAAAGGGAAPTAGKTLHCLRHGQSEINAYFNLHRYGSPHSEPLRDPLLWDARLTDGGLAAAGAAAPAVAALRPDVVLVSPLARALQTAVAAAAGCGRVRIEAHPLLRERLLLSSEVGRRRSELEVEFPSVDFSALGDGDACWWWPQASRAPGAAVAQEPPEAYAARLPALRALLAARPERVLLLVSHAGVLAHLTGVDLPPCGLTTRDGWLG
jgi:broad specificity phosphatase PhoE